MVEHQSKREYAIWGIPKGKTEDTLLYTKARSMGEARRVMKTLRNTYGARAMRVQVIDLSKPINFSDLFANIVRE